MTRGDFYLAISDAYVERLGGWRWSRTGDAVEYSSGYTLVLVDQLSQILEGVFSRPDPPPFEFVLHALVLLKQGRDALPGGGSTLDISGIERLRTVCERIKPSGRNLGVFLSAIAPEPRCSEPPTFSEVDAALRRRALDPTSTLSPRPFGPGLTPTAFLAAITDKLAGWTNDQIESQLRSGEQPVPEAKKLAEELQSFPERLQALAAEIAQRPRLLAAAALVPVLDAAIAFPARRPEPNRLPQGGYADVATRGAPDQILPSQFALDPDEFVRRFAERELLYFRREDPHQPTTPERILLLDQGVRTWGKARLGLAAGAIALVGKDPKKFGITITATTASPVPLSFGTCEISQFADSLEASDLSVNPAELLESMLMAEADGPRDLVLFTHPRSLAEESVLRAVRRRKAEDRLFAVALDDSGKAELGEWSEAGYRTIRRFRVDLDAAPADRTDERVREPQILDGWSGAIEPVLFPFRAGLVVECDGVFGFDSEGETLVVVGRGGAVHAIRTQSEGGVDLLPRAMKNGVILKEIEKIRSARGGVVLVGLIDKVPVYAHYDFHKRRVTIHDQYDITEPQSRRIAIAPARMVLDKPYLETVDEAFVLRNAGEWEPIRPTIQGRPMPRGATAHEAILAGNVLAVTIRSGGRFLLYVLRGPQGDVLAELFPVYQGQAFQLSPDGSQIARSTGGRGVELRSTALGSTLRRSIPNGGYHSAMKIDLSPERLTLHVGRYTHAFTLNEPIFHHEKVTHAPTTAERAQTPRTAPRAISDTQRFVEIRESGPWTCAFDRWGQVVLLDSGGEPFLYIVARRDLAAAWLRDGTRWGAVALLGAPPHPNAAVRIGTALRQTAEKQR